MGKDLLISFPPPRVNGKALKVKFIAQVKTRPPCFAIFVNAMSLPGFYERFLRSRIQEDFDLVGVPLRFLIRKSEGREVKKHLLKQGARSNYRRGQGLSRGVGNLERQRGGLASFVQKKRRVVRKELRKKSMIFKRKTAKVSPRKKNRGSYT